MAFPAQASKVFLPQDLKDHRLAMADGLLRDVKLDESWWYNNVVWFDPCASILPGSLRQYQRMKQAMAGGKGWHSDNAKQYSPNLRGAKEALKQISWEGTKVNWFMVLAKGRAHVEIMPDDWTLDGKGVAQFVLRLPGILRRMLGLRARLPKIVFTDRGTGLYSPQGCMVAAYEEALDTVGLKGFWGHDARAQAPDTPDLLLHETAIAHFRSQMRREKPAVVPWQESVQQWSDRAEICVGYMHAQYNLASLCRAFPKRMRELQAKQGERLTCWHVVWG